MKFEELKLSPGYPLQIQVSDPSGQSDRWPCRLIGAVPGRSLLISVPRSGGRLVRFRPGQKILARMMVANGVGAFASVVEAQTADPYPLIYLSHPKDISFKGVRGATRVGVEQPVIATNLSALSEQQVSGKLADISVTGARLELDTVLGDIGDKILLQTRVEVAGIERDLTIEAILRSRIERSTQESTQNLPVVYGIEFTETDEERRLLLYAYVFSQIAHDQSPTP
ncbi:flagellar brake protein [Marinimicrobium sp. ABcell2]|uniref:flagellar brake protein n=1 Tax=Marinimicrobium sp. ABcell2 TaxID=3069751 RepID=UPI0027B15B6E|nr:flagellar brake protein [Marinimicrobium sp. ABcell2]MDQ2075064.1 flagellar brake protein [Marinimicrobium sp. ABcell2]